MAKSNGHTASMNRSFISSWIKTALPTISTYSMTSFASGRTTTITIDRTEPSMGRPHTRRSWQKRPVIFSPGLPTFLPWRIGDLYEYYRPRGARQRGGYTYHLVRQAWL